MKTLLKSTIIMVAILSSLLVLVSCSKKEVNQNIVGPSSNIQSAEDEQSIENTIKISTLSLEDPQEMAKRYKPLCDYLEQKVGKKFEFIPQQNIEQLIKEFKQNTVDIANLGPAQYIKVHDEFGAKILAKSLENESSTFEYVMFSRDDSGYSDINSIKGKKLAAFNDFPSIKLLSENGIKKDELAELKILNNQNEVIMSVLSKDYEFGTVTNNVFKKNKDKGIKIIASGSLPTFSMVSRAGLDQKVSEDIKKALLELKDTKILQSINNSYTGFTDGKDEDYQHIRDYMRKLGMLKQ